MKGGGLAGEEIGVMAYGLWGVEKFVTILL
jgi:hypothetical protein